MKLLKRSLVLLGCALVAAAAFTACELGLGGDDRLNVGEANSDSGSVTLTFGDYDPDYSTRSEAVSAGKGEAKKIEFTVNSVGTDNWSTPAYIISNADDEFLYIFRTDNWCNGPVPESFSGEADPAVAYNNSLKKICDWDFDTFLDYLPGSKAVATIENNGSTANLKIVFTKGSETHTQSYVDLPLETNGTIKLFISGENSSVTITGTGTVEISGDDGDDDEPSDTPEEEIPPVDSEDWETADNSISYSGTIKNSLIPAFDVGNGGFTVEFKATMPAGTNDWGAHILTYKGFQVTIPNLDPYNNTVDDDLKGINAYPTIAGASLKNGLKFDSAFDGKEHTIKLVFTKDSITYWLDGTEWVEYSNSVWEGKISDFISCYVEGLKKGEVLFNAASLEISDITISKDSQ